MNQVVTFSVCCIFLQPGLTLMKISTSMRSPTWTIRAEMEAIDMAADTSGDAEWARKMAMKRRTTMGQLAVWVAMKR